MLCDQSVNIETRYNDLITSAEEIAFSKLHTHIIASIRVRKARKDVHRVKPGYEQELIKSTFKATIRVQWILDVGHANVDADCIQGEIEKFVRLHTEEQHAVVLETINTLSGRKSVFLSA